jgi:hypothetical protein
MEGWQAKHDGVVISKYAKLMLVYYSTLPLQKKYHIACGVQCGIFCVSINSVGVSIGVWGYSPKARKVISVCGYNPLPWANFGNM